MNKINFNNFNLSKDILKALEQLGYKNPSEVQEKVIPFILGNKDVIVKSQTGSGKTASFAIPICENIQLEERKPQVLVLTPTRELAIQIKQDFSSIGLFKRINCIAVFGKEPSSIQKDRLNQRVHVIVGTPGRTLDHIKKNNLDVKKIKYLVIDEADEMFNMGFISQVKSIIDKLPKNRSTFLFSATIPKEILELCDSYMNHPNNIEVASKNSIQDKIRQIYYEVESYKKFDLLNKIIYKELPDSSIIFCRTKKNVDDLIEKMKNKGYSCSALHGGMLQAHRIDVMEKFKRGEFTFLVSTDIAARGIDVENITHIINYDIPMEKESYVHRIGRTGRAGNTGVAITLVTPREYRFLHEIALHYEFNIEKGTIPSLEEVERGKQLFKQKSKIPHKPKNHKSEKLNNNVTKIYISAGKKKKIRPGDIAGAIASIPGINADDIGIINIQDNFSYVDILSDKGTIVLDGLKGKTIKGKSIRAEIAQK